ncbi:MAG: host attachment protein [Comamonadaceae bacterium]|nr:MAG: host attachment protein [Comamonadaceae bacterium]
MKTLWIVVADEAIARILVRAEAGNLLDPVEELTDPLAHAQEADLHRDAQGRRAGSATHGNQNASQHRLRSGASATASAGEDEQHLEAAGFARRVAQRLSEARQQKRFDELQLVAAPRFLGLLRKALSAEVAACVTKSLDKDFVHLQNDDLSARLFGA